LLLTEMKSLIILFEALTWSSLVNKMIMRMLWFYLVSQMLMIGWLNRMFKRFFIIGL
jgi:hypothetical protein